jgi:hypothetical protein
MQRIVAGFDVFGVWLDVSCKELLDLMSLEFGFVTLTAFLHNKKYRRL